MQKDHYFVLDADNLLYPRCLQRCLESLSATDAAFVYPLIERFGQVRDIINTQVWTPALLAYDNYIGGTAKLRALTAPIATALPRYISGYVYSY